jgi:hypothetical protein
MSGYLELARRGRASWEGYWHCSTSKAVAGMQPVCHNLSIHLGPEDRRLQSAGLELKECGGKIVWERLDTGFWEFQEMALHHLESKSAEEGRRA